MNKTSKIDEMDLLLYSAMLYIEHKEVGVYDKAADVPVTLSEKDKKRILKRIIRAGEYWERHEVYHPWLETIKRVAVIALVVMSLCFTGVMSVEAVRVTLWETIIEWYEKSIFFAYVNGDESVAPDRILEYREPVLGDEYERYEGIKNEYNYVLEYESDQFLITYSQSLLENYSVMLSNHDTEMMNITVNGYLGTMTIFVTEGIPSTTIIWHDNEYTYMISSNLSYDELLKVAESVQ